MNRNDDYPYIRAWGRMLGSGRSYIEDQVAQARADKAPASATHVDHGTQQWNTTDDIISQVTRFQLGLPPVEPDAPAVMRHYDATLHTVPGPGAVIGFPSLHAAIGWASTYRVTDRAELVTDGSVISFGEPVTVLLQPAAVTAMEEGPARG